MGDTSVLDLGRISYRAPFREQFDVAVASQNRPPREIHQNSIHTVSTNPPELLYLVIEPPIDTPRKNDGTGTQMQMVRS